MLRTVHSAASTVTSPVRVRNSGPDAPTQSPMSMSESVSYESGRLFFLRRTCILPWPSWRPRNVALPMPLRRTMRPATETGAVRCPSPCSFSSASNREAASAEVWLLS